MNTHYIIKHFRKSDPSELIYEGSVGQCRFYLEALMAQHEFQYPEEFSIRDPKGRLNSIGSEEETLEIVEKN